MATGNKTDKQLNYESFVDLGDREAARRVVRDEENYTNVEIDNNQLLVLILKQIHIMNIHLASITGLDLEHDDIEGY